MAAPVVTMRPVVFWNNFQTSGLDVANLDSDLGYVLGGKSNAGAVKAQLSSNYTGSPVSFDSLAVNITNHANRNGNWFRSNDLNYILNSDTGTSKCQIASYIPGINTVYLYVLLAMNYNAVPVTPLDVYQSSTSNGVPTAGPTVSQIHNYQLSSGDYILVRVYKITKSQDYIHVILRNTSTSATMFLLNAHFFTESDAYIFDQVNDRLVWGAVGGNGQNWNWLSTNIPYTPYSGNDLLVPYYYDDNADQLIEMNTVSPVESSNIYGYSMLFQFEGQHYGPAGVNLWDDISMSERYSKMFTENVIGIWKPTQIDSTLTASHTRAKSATDNGYNIRLAGDTGIDMCYLIGLLSEMHYDNTDINPTQSGQESPVINLDYSYV